MSMTMSEIQDLTLKLARDSEALQREFDKRTEVFRTRFATATRRWRRIISGDSRDKQRRRRLWSTDYRSAPCSYYHPEYCHRLFASS